LFGKFSSTALRDVIGLALFIFSDRKVRKALISQAVLAEHDWSDRVPTYLALLQHISGALNYAHLSERQRLLKKILA